VTSDGQRLIALLGQRSTCLALIAPVGFSMVKSRCDLEFNVNVIVSASPEGRFLAALSQNGVDVFDLDSVWTRPGPVANWEISGTSVAWLADGTFVVINRAEVYRLRVNIPDRQEVSTVPLTMGQELQTITDLRG
jgi:hypothetical protein